MTPLQLSIFLTLSAVSGIAITTLFGHWLDRSPSLWPLFASLARPARGVAA